jgi:hypothetical protein
MEEQERTESRADGRRKEGQAAGQSREAAGTFWETAAEIGNDPFTKGIARTYLELVRLMRRRAQVYAELPVRLARCHTLEALSKSRSSSSPSC